MTDLATHYLGVLPSALPVFAVGAITGVLAVAYRPRWLVAAAVAAGLGFAWTQRSLVDDAFITFRYVANLLEGHGPVWNPGERVEGITNFGWMLLLAAASAVAPIPLEQVALLLCVASYLALVLLTAALGRALGGTVALAAPLLAVQYSVTAFATTGLEAEAAAALGVAGALALRTRADAVGAGLAGAAWIGATVIRMDHAVLYAVGSAWVAARYLPRRDVPALVAYALPFGAWLAVTGWRAWFYGDWLPNTWYAKGAGEPWVEQGLLYLATVLASGHLWAAVALALAWPAVERPENRPFAAWAGGVTLLYGAYVIRVGGDFMLGRFWLLLLPLVLLGAERAVLCLWASSRGAGLAAAALLGATLRGIPLLEPAEVRWGIADESTVYPLTSVAPVRVGHSSFRAGHRLHRLFTSRGITFPIATSGIGMVGYYSRLELIDRVGLTDVVVARNPIEERTRPGHERRPPRGYLDERGVRLARIEIPDEWRELMDLDLGKEFVGEDRWVLYTYDRELMARIAAEVPEVRFTDFDVWFAEQYRPTIPLRSKAELRRDLAVLDRFYWDVNGPDERRDELARHLR